MCPFWEKPTSTQAKWIQWILIRIESFLRHDVLHFVQCYLLHCIIQLDFISAQCVWSMELHIRCDTHEPNATYSARNFCVCSLLPLLLLFVSFLHFIYLLRFCDGLPCTKWNYSLSILGILKRLCWHEENMIQHTYTHSYARKKSNSDQNYAE